MSARDSMFTELSSNFNDMGPTTGNDAVAQQTNIRMAKTMLDIEIEYRVVSRISKELSCGRTHRYVHAVDEKRIQTIQSIESLSLLFRVFSGQEPLRQTSFRCSEVQMIPGK